MELLGTVLLIESAAALLAIAFDYAFGPFFAFDEAEKEWLLGLEEKAEPDQNGIEVFPISANRDEATREQQSADIQIPTLASQDSFIDTSVTEIKTTTQMIKKVRFDVLPIGTKKILKSSDSTSATRSRKSVSFASTTIEIPTESVKTASTKTVTFDLPPLGILRTASSGKYRASKRVRFALPPLSCVKDPFEIKKGAKKRVRFASKLHGDAKGSPTGSGGCSGRELGSIPIAGIQERRETVSQSSFFRSML